MVLRFWRCSLYTKSVDDILLLLSCSVCGMPVESSVSAGRILGGQDAKLGEIPWQLLIKEPKRGGASLINDQWAVTAAHVVEKIPDTSLVLYGGLVEENEITSAHSPNLVIMESEKIITHPGYAKGLPDNDPNKYDNDIALIKLSSRVNFGPNLLPVCLPEVNSGLLENEQGTVSGWGITDNNPGKKLKTAHGLKYAQIGVYSPAECEDTPVIPRSAKRMVFTNNMFCAGADGKDSCKQDSGGPFVTPMVSASGGPYYLSGVVSFGSLCRERRYKGYYTKVQNYVNWIKNTIDEQETS